MMMMMMMMMTNAKSSFKFIIKFKVFSVENARVPKNSLSRTLVGKEKECLFKWSSDEKKQKIRNKK